MELFAIFIGAILVNNFILTRFLGICSFLGQSKNVGMAVGMGMAVIFVLTLSSIATNLLYIKARLSCNCIFYSNNSSSSAIGRYSFAEDATCFTSGNGHISGLNHDQLRNTWSCIIKCS
jgi:Na+-transporting NADH:ubiquinone oxidoreductase subunit NqrE